MTELAADAPLGVFYYLDPRDLTLGTNIRHDTKLSPEFVASIKARGVLEPVVAHWGDGNAVIVDQGQRRTLAAVEARLTQIPVLVHAAPPDEADRLVDQWTENEHRESLTNGERVGAVEQLALIGLDVNQIARRLHAPAADVAAAQKLVGSSTAKEYLEDRSMTLDQAAILAEFDDDRDAVATLARLVRDGRGIEHEAERYRQDRSEKAAIATRTAELTEQGLTVIPKPGWQDRKKTLELLELRDGRRKIDPDKHAADCPGHVAWVTFSWGNSAAGRELQVTPGCTNWSKHGHRTSDTSTASVKLTAADMTEEERIRAAAERRHVIESNKAWRAATVVRRRWLLEFWQRKTAPTGAEAFVAAAIDRAQIHGHEARRLLGHDGMSYGFGTGAYVDELAAASPKRALQIALCLAIASWEADSNDDTWRATQSTQATAAYVLSAISQSSHELSDIEEHIVDGTAGSPS